MKYVRRFESKGKEGKDAEGIKEDMFNRDEKCSRSVFFLDFIGDRRWGLIGLCHSKERDFQILLVERRHL
jgi:hypothetical protein